MLGLNRQEQQIALFLLVSFCVGCGIKLYQNHRACQLDPEWRVRYDTIYQQFKHAQSVDETPSTTTAQTAVLKKQDLIGKVNINTANSIQLQTLRKIGPALAERIISYRQKNGPFREIIEIKKVKGIGDKTFEQIKNNLTVE
jgi:comEA protein